MGNSCYKGGGKLEKKIDGNTSNNQSHSRRESENRRVTVQPSVSLGGDERLQPPVVSLAVAERLKIINKNQLAENTRRRNAERASLREQQELADAEQQKEIKKQKAIQIQYIKHQMRQTEYDLSQRLKNLTILEPEKIVKNTEMIDDFLMEIDGQPHYSRAIYTKETLDQFSSEYSRVERLFRATNKKCFTVQKIEKIYNPYLLLQYSLKKMRYMAKNGMNVEHELFHGTRKSNIDSICTKNFNWRLRGSAKGHKFGQGMSFTPISNYATHYGDDGYDKVMFLVKVLIVNKCLGAQNMHIPPGNYDTTTNEKEHVIVKYEDNDYYPAYVIYYGGIDMYQNSGRGRNRGGYRRNY